MGLLSSCCLDMLTFCHMLPCCHAPCDHMACCQVSCVMLSVGMFAHGYVNVPLRSEPTNLLISPKDFLISGISGIRGETPMPQIPPHKFSKNAHLQIPVVSLRTICTTGTWCLIHLLRATRNDRLNLTRQWRTSSVRGEVGQMVGPMNGNNLWARPAVQILHAKCELAFIIWCGHFSALKITEIIWT